MTLFHARLAGGALLVMTELRAEETGPTPSAQLGEQEERESTS
jgi:hypothetical protein